jgi:hypothetical protein
MDENEKTPPQKPQSDKKLKLDLSEALNPGFDDDDDIIELKDEVTPAPRAEKANIGIDDQVNEDIQGDKPAAETISRLELGKEADVAENVHHLADDLEFEEEDEDQAELLPPLDEEFLKTDAADEVEEITEFDDVLSEDSNEMMTLADVGDESEPEEEFLELIDVEEDSLTEEGNEPEMAEETVGEEIEDDIIQFDGPGEDVEDAELEDFINDSLGEEIRIDDNFEDDLTNALGVEAESDINLAGTSSGTEEFDFEMDSSEISEKIDQLDTIFFDESQAEDKLEEDAESETEAIRMTVSDHDNETDEISEKIDRLETTFFDESEAEAELDEDDESEAAAIGMNLSDDGNETDEISEKIGRRETTFFDESEPEAKLDEDDESEAEEIGAAGDKTDEGDFEITDVEPSGEPLAEDALTALAGASQEQIEKSIERVIEQNFTGKIESMVTEAIEKAVSKEIDRLKNILLEDDGEDNL